MTEDEEKLLSAATKGVVSALIDKALDFFHFLFDPKRYTRKNPKNKIGLIFAVVAHNKDEEERLQVDLIKPLRQELSQLPFGNVFNVMEVSLTESEKIKDVETASEFLRKKRSHMIIYGDLVLRNLKGEQNHVFRLNGIVRHSLLPIEIVKQFSGHFREMLPEISWFPTKEELGNFEVKKQEITYLIKYIIGVAAFLSNDFNLSKELFEDSLKKLLTIPDVDSIQPFSKFLYFTRKRLSEVLFVYLKIAYAKFRRTRSKEEILSIKNELEILKDIDPDNYPAHLTRAIYLFFNNQTEKAIEELKNVHNSDVSWRYSLGFLFAYSGRIDEALEQYRKTQYNLLSDKSILLDIEIFISEVIAKEPEKIQLLFFRGLINHKQKGDEKLAKEDFENFLTKDNNRFPKLEELAKKYLSNLS